MYCSFCLEFWLKISYDICEVGEREPLQSAQLSMLSLQTVTETVAETD